jgi:hypothetical protein
MYAIDGQLESKEKFDFGKTGFLIHAFIDGVDVASAKVDKKGKYKLTFESADEPTLTEIRIMPDKPVNGYQDAPVFRINPSLYQENAAGGYSVKYNLPIPPVYINPFIHKSFHVHGTVFTTQGDYLTGAKIEFYEHVKRMFMIPPGYPNFLEVYRGSAFTTLDGSYDFKFESTFWKYDNDFKADIYAKIYIFVDGKWVDAYDSEMYVDIDEDQQLYFHVPIILPPHGARPSTGFLFSSVGLLPIDSTRISAGYATSMQHDPLQVTHQPFCETLRIFGLFAFDVATYKVDIVETNKWGNILGDGKPTPIMDALWNNYWDDTLKAWMPEFLGPDPVTGIYKNIDADTTKVWCEPALKVSWDTLNGPSKMPDGYYQLSITGYDKNGDPVSQAMPYMRICNNFAIRVETKIEAVGATDCGILALNGDKEISLTVTAFDPDPEGAVLYYWIVGTWGKNGLSAGYDSDPVAINNSGVHPRLIAANDWNGNQDKAIDYKLTDLSWQNPPKSCPFVAYNFELWIQGSPTNCYSSTLISQSVWVETNLVVSK